MKNRKNILFLILSIYLATIGAACLTISTTENYALAQPAKLSSQQTITNTPKEEKMPLKSISVILTTVSAIVAVITYIKNESWKRRQYLEEKIKEFEDTLEAINIRKILSAELQCVELFPFLEKPTHRFVIVEDCLWAEALLECKCNATLKEEYKKIDKDAVDFYKQQPAVKACIRDNFNRFIHDIQQFEKMMKSGIIDEKILKYYVEPWFKFIDCTNDKFTVECPSSSEHYSPKEALLEYMGLLERIPEEQLSVTQKDVRALVLRFRTLSSFKIENKQKISPQACELSTTAQS